jgi:predicted O-methyltransferase YrrM
MNFNESIQTLATYYKLDASELLAYADEDNIGGYDDKHNGKVTRTGNPVWEIGSLWEVEGKILYALIRALKPAHVVEIGSFHGCSATHICEALLKNGKGKLTSVDINHNFKPPAKFKGVLKQVQIDLFKYEFPKTPKVDFVFEDALHEPGQVSHIWNLFKKSAKKGAAILSHDAEHYIVGADVRMGIGEIVEDYKTILVAPSDCGFAYWKKA